MKVSQIEQLQQSGYSVSNNFKTVGSYGLQPIILGNISYRIVSIYIEFVRPIIKSNKDKWDPNESLWIDFKGRTETRIGSLITAYFRRKLKVYYYIQNNTNIDMMIFIIIILR